MIMLFPLFVTSDYHSSTVKTSPSLFTDDDIVFMMERSIYLAWIDFYVHDVQVREWGELGNELRYLGSKQPISVSITVASVVFSVNSSFLSTHHRKTQKSDRPGKFICFQK